MFFGTGKVSPGIRHLAALTAGSVCAVSLCSFFEDSESKFKGQDGNKRGGFIKDRLNSLLEPQYAHSLGNGGGHNVRRYPFVILGSGTAAHAALEAIRMNEPHGEVLMISANEGTLLPRMDKSSSVPNQAESVLEQRLRQTYDEWRRQLSSSLDEPNEQVSLIRASQVKIDVEERTITLSDRKVQYDKCLLATSGRPREFYVLDWDKIAHSTANESINTLHTLVDFRALANVVVPSSPSSSAGSTGTKKHVTVVGGGYLGTEIVTSLAETGACKVVHVMGERTPLAQYVPQYLSEHLMKKLAALGVEVKGEALVTGLQVSGVKSPQSSDQVIALEAAVGAESTPAAVPTMPKRSRSIHPTDAVAAPPVQEEQDVEGRISLHLVGANKTQLKTDYVVLASTNVQPDLMGLDDPSVGIEVADGGLVTNAALEAYDCLFVAGNAATYYDPSIGRRRVDTYDHAVASGMWAAHNMMSHDRLEQYTHQPCFRSHLAGIGLNFIGVGKIDAKLETIGVWFRAEHEGTEIATSPVESTVPGYKRGVVYYLERGRVVGILLCNADEMLERARDVLRARKVVTDPVSQVPKFILLAPSHWLHVIATK